MRAPLAGWLLVLALALANGPSRAAEGPAARSAPHVGITLENRFVLEDAEVVIAPSRAWVSLLPNEGDFARFDHRQLRGVRIALLRVPLAELPADQDAANASYERYVKGLGRQSFVKDMRPPPSVSVGRFAQCFTLSTGEAEPPRAMRVLLVEGKYLYDVRLEVAERLTGELRKDYHAALASLRIEPPKVPENAGAVPPTVTTNTLAR